MSRIGKLPIEITAGVTVEIANNIVKVKGKLGDLTQSYSTLLDIVQIDNKIVLTRNIESKDANAQHGLTRSLIANMILGVSEGYKKQLELVGVGYRAKANNQQLELSLGFSHNIVFKLPSEITIIAEQSKGRPPIITLSSFDKQLLGQVTAKIRSLRKPEPYKGKGIKFVGEQIRRKAGKSAGK